jgi:hypothetical protein
MRTSWERVGQPVDGECVPRFITPRHPERRSIGHELVATAGLLKRYPLPWQADVFDRAFEVDAAGVLWYREIVVVVPRQSGKTTIIVPWGVHRCTTWPERQFMLYTAQTRKAARAKWIDDQVFLITQSPFRKLIKPNRSGRFEPNLSHGEEHIPWANGSKWMIDAPTETAGHGPTLDLGVADEFFSQKDARVEGAMSPAMITRPDSQKLFISTPGPSKAKSPELWAKVEAGRNRVRAGLDSRSLYVEYSASDDVDWLDPLAWWQTMPALGYTVTQDSVQAEAESMGEEEFRRAYLAQWADEMAVDTKIPWPAWVLCHDAESQAGSHNVWVIDCSPERTHTSISLASQRADGLTHVEVIESSAGTGWAPRRLGELLRAHGGAVYWDHATVGPIADELLEELPQGVLGEAITADDMRMSAPALLDAALTQSVRHLMQWELNDALTSARARKLSGGDSWGWSRGLSMADITSLMSVTVAHWMLRKSLPDLKYDPMSGLR